MGRAVPNIAPLRSLRNVAFERVHDSERQHQHFCSIRQPRSIVGFWNGHTDAHCWLMLLARPDKGTTPDEAVSDRSTSAG